MAVYLRAARMVVDHLIGWSNTLGPALFIACLWGVHRLGAF